MRWQGRAQDSEPGDAQPEELPGPFPLLQPEIEVRQDNHLHIQCQSCSCDCTKYSVRLRIVSKLQAQVAAEKQTARLPRNAERRT